MDVLTSPTALLGILFAIIGIVVGLGLLAGLGYLAFQLFVYYTKTKHREKESLDSVLLQVSVPRDNEIKIDAAEQMFASLASLHKGGHFSFLKEQPHLSFEIVGLPGDIRFFIYTPNKLRDLIEKQINGAYPDAEIVVVNDRTLQGKGTVIGNEYNIFSKNGKVAFASLRLKSEAYKPMKVYKDLAVIS